MLCSRVLIVVAFALIASPASACMDPSTGCGWQHDGFAEVPITAKEAFYGGKYAQAAILAEADGSLAALVFAARARTADAIERNGGMCLDCLIKAEAAAEAAIALATSKPRRPAWDGSFPSDAMLAQAYVELAIAVGFHGRMLSSTEALSEGLAEKGRAAIDSALKLSPQNPWARAALGGWHLEIVHRAGSILASTMYGANEEEGLKNFRDALEAERHDTLLSYQYALSILALDPERFKDEAIAELEQGLKNQRIAREALRVATHEHASKLMETLKTGSNDDIAALVRSLQGYPQN